MNQPSRPRLAQPRDLPVILRDSLVVLYENLGALLTLAAAVVVPMQLIVSGLGLEQLTAAYDANPSAAAYAIPGLLNLLVVTPLITAICIHALNSVAAGERPAPRRALVEGFEAFSRIFFAVALAALGATIGLLVFVVPGIYLFFRWYFVPQAVVIAGAAGPAALSHSAALTRGHWWRTFGIVLIANIAALVPGLLLNAPFTAIADSTDRAVWSLAGTIVTETITAPFLALVSTFLYYDLRARSAGGV